uniref:Uncharacterized protein n=1 Tax=Quercus lobata TaxID=97700 RepID=A0A7N2MC99_QUELO
MIWGIIRRKVISPKVLGESVQRIRPAVSVSGPQCYRTMRKENRCNFDSDETGSLYFLHGIITLSSLRNEDIA